MTKYFIICGICASSHNVSVPVATIILLRKNWLDTDKPAARVWRKADGLSLTELRVSLRAKENEFIMKVKVSLRRNIECQQQGSKWEPSLLRYAHHLIL